MTLAVYMRHRENYRIENSTNAKVKPIEVKPVEVKPVVVKPINWYDILNENPFFFTY